MQLFRTQKFTTQNKYKEESLDGKNYYVVPVIAMIEGVRFGGSQEYPELGLAKDFGKVPAGWNTSPVVMNHPQSDNGVFLSAGTKDVLENSAFGMVLNTELKDKQLHMEAWLDVDKRNLSDDVSRVFERLENSEIVEISVSFFCDIEDPDVEGSYNGQKYKGVWTNIVPDHLAILSEGQIGACSVKNGCGTRTQQTKEETMEIKSQCSCTPELSQEQLTQVLSALKVNAAPAELLANNISTALDVAINTQLGTLWSYVYTFNQDTVIYYDSHASKVYQQSYDIDENYKVTLKGDAVEAVLLSTLITKSTIIEGKDMKVNNEATPAVETPAAEATPTIETPVTETTPVTEATPAVTEAEEITAQAYIEKAPPAIREVLEESLRANKAKREKLVANIKANKSSNFTDEFLVAQSTATLENLAALATPAVNYGGTASAAPIVAQSEGVPTAPRVFEKKK